MVDELLAQADLGARQGFDGVMTSEHHNGFPGYLPNPIQTAGWCLDVMEHGWAAPSPLLILLRPTALVAEEVAWLAARFPGRVGLAVAAGALASDFEVMDLTMNDLASRFSTALEQLTGMLDGSAPGPLAGDTAVAACAARPVPVLSAAMGATAARRAARLGTGILLDSLSTPERCRELTDTYRAAGGSGSCVAVRRAWIGEPPRARTEAQVDVYRTYSSSVARAHWGDDELVSGPDGTMVTEQLADVARRAGVDALNLRVHAPGIAPESAREQIVRLGTEVVGPLRAALSRGRAR